MLNNEILFIGVMFHLFLILAVVSIVVSSYLINNLGLGRETKSKILWRHIAIVVAYSTCNSYLLYCFY